MARSTMAPAVREVPALTTAARTRPVQTSERSLANGLSVTAVRRSTVPMVEVRMRIPFLSAKQTHLARSTLLAETILTGTELRDRLGLATVLQEIGGDLSVGLDADRLLLSASALSSRLADLLALIAEVVTSATYPNSEFAGERDRLLERITMARSQPSVIAAEAVGRRVAPGHPYGLVLPATSAVAATTAAQVRGLHRDLVRPAGATLVIVGDVTTARALDTAERAFATWTGQAVRTTVPALPALVERPMLLVDRPGAVQTSLRFSGVALPRSDERFAALQLANLAFGGYFSSRWVENIREDKGYTYSPRSSLEHARLGSSFTASADVATEVTAPAVLETFYELGKIASLPITDTELESVRQYALGTQALSTATQSGLASTLSGLLGAGLDAQWLTDHRARLAAVTIADVFSVASEFMAPRRLVGVAVGDASAMSEALSNIAELDVEPAAESA